MGSWESHYILKIEGKSDSSLIVNFVLFMAKKFDHTTKYTKITKVIYFILLFLRDLRGKNKTDLFWLRLVRVEV